MQDKVGQIFTGTISGITEWGMFVELDTKGIEGVEGLVPLRDIKEDYLVFDEESYTLTGKQSRKNFILGQAVKVKVERANLEQKQLDFTLIWEGETSGIPTGDRDRERDTKRRAKKDRGRR